jgi:hypothetical protein
MTTQPGAISKRRKFVADGVFYAELNEFFQRELAEEGYSGVEVRVTPTVTDISTISLRRPRDHISTVFWQRRLRLTGCFCSYPRNTHPRSPRRTRPSHSRTHLSDPETLQVPREQCIPVRCQSPEPWSLRRRPVRVPQIQTPQRIGSASCLLWCATVHHGERSQRL